MNGFEFDFSKIFWGGARRTPSPDPSPRFFSGFALGSGFAVNSRAHRALDSGFALDTRALRALDSGFALNLRLGILIWPPQSKFLDPPVMLRRSHMYRMGKGIEIQVYSTQAYEISFDSEKPFAYVECNIIFSQQSNLTRHIMIHTGEKPFVFSKCVH